MEQATQLPELLITLFRHMPESTLCSTALVNTQWSYLALQELWEMRMIPFWAFLTLLGPVHFDDSPAWRRYNVRDCFTIHYTASKVNRLAVIFRSLDPFRRIRGM